MLDNFSHSMLMEATKLCQSTTCELEVSGGVDASTICDIAALGVDYISVGAITKSVRAIDLSLLIQSVPKRTRQHEA